MVASLRRGRERWFRRKGFLVGTVCAVSFGVGELLFGQEPAQSGARRAY